MSADKKDQGAHYRFELVINPDKYLRDQNGMIHINLDPFRIADIYGMTCFALQTILKKCLCAGNRGHKDQRQDLLDIICAAERKLEMIEEDAAKRLLL